MSEAEFQILKNQAKIISMLVTLLSMQSDENAVYETIASSVAYIEQTHKLLTKYSDK